ncbi:MAG TPA: DNA polymerase III subunit alpha [Saprospiraceae bacterium]|nr:DNA polymerase III subunit alpha [Saprospiraceae bacterium]
MSSHFCHLHCHTQFSLLDGATDISSMMKKAKEDGMMAVALTDHGNMFGCFDFVKEAEKNKIKPILGCEFYMVKDRHKQSFVKSAGEKDERFHQLLLAKNQEGYENLSKLCSLGFIEGMYGKFPRIDKELLLKHHKGLIATSCCIGAEIPQAIIHGNMEEAESLLRWWIDLLGEDFYIEIQRQAGNENIDGMGISQEEVNQKLLQLAAKYQVKVIATNDVHYLEEDDAESHDILLCINTASNVLDEDRFRFSSSEYFFKSTREMAAKFADVPQAIEQTVEIAEKVFHPNLIKEIVLPNFPLPPGFSTQDEYLRFLVYEGAQSRYGEISEKVRERLDYELGVISKMKFAGYFLVVQDFIHAARVLKVGVGPGRGSAAGSAVAYCLTITDIDPLRYNLLFERFLNPERVSMPDIDIDFDDRNRDKVLDYVVDKYGSNQVAQIVTFGTMAAKSSIRDVARVKNVELSKADYLAKLVPTRPNVKLKEIIDINTPISDDFNPDEKQKIQLLRNIVKENTAESDVLKTAMKLEGSVRNTGLHAAGVIIAPEDIMKIIPVATSKDSKLWVTQVEGSVIENTGLLKIDFLGLRTLSIIDDALENIVKVHGEEKRIKLDEIPLDDEKTLQLFQQGLTVGLFQFESDGMRGHLRNLKPSNIEDIIAMNALFRPGPMAYIDEFISRKHGKTAVSYPHEWLTELLKPTYGIMVYQEQIMQAAQIMADYSLGEADILRRAMGKKKKDEMDKQSAIFVERAMKKSISQEKAQEIFDVMSKFAAYGFNRSHAAAYSILAFQTGYLKCHYPAEFMAAVLTANKNDIGDLRKYLLETKLMKVEVLGPDINESDMDFTISPNGAIRFGLSALKGIGEGPVEDIIAERNAKGKFKNFPDMVMRLNSKVMNKKIAEACAMGGAFDSFAEMHRAQYFAPIDKYPTYIECILKWGHNFHNTINSAFGSLFGEEENRNLEFPTAPQVAEWSTMQKLDNELQIAGIYISGHPLDDYLLEIKHLSSYSLEQLNDADLKIFEGKKLKLCGMVSDVVHRTTAKGDGYCNFTLDDFHGSLKFGIFSENYLKFKSLLEKGKVLLIECSVEKQRWKQDSDAYDFRISHIQLLSTALEHYYNKIAVSIPVTQLTDKSGAALSNVFKKYRGNQFVHFEIYDSSNDFMLEFHNQKIKVHITSDLLKELTDLHVYYRLMN